MPQWLSDAIHLGIPALITATLLGYLRGRGAARRQRPLRECRPTSFKAFLRGNAPPYPRRWRYSWLEVGLGFPTFKPRFSIVRRPITLPASATVESIRPVSGLVESILTNPDCVVIVVRAGDVSLELAVVKINVSTALESLASGTVGTWRVSTRLGTGW
jgi:hypothetical protein